MGGSLVDPFSAWASMRPMIPMRIPTICLMSLIAAVGCRFRDTSRIDFHDSTYLQERIRGIEYPDVEVEALVGVRDTPRPVVLSEQTPPPIRELTLEQAIQLALVNATVLRDLGGLVLQSPQSLATTMAPAMAEMDPRVGPEAALSAFDATLAAGAYFENNDRPFNNQVTGLGTQLFQQDLNTYNLELRKRTAEGTQLAVREKLEYDYNNSPFNNDPNLPWTSRLEGEIRQPLLQGAGSEFNRIAGPNSVPGFYNGVLIGRVNTDVSLADFEAGVTQLVSNVENAYWELYLAFRGLDAKVAARNQAYNTWNQIQVLSKRGAGGALEATSEALAREQLLRLEAEVQNSLAGRVVEKSNSQAFREPTGVYSAERRLRRAIGIPAADGTLLRPADEPLLAEMAFSWEELLEEALARRVELRRQKWLIKRRELELIASKNFLLPRVDAFGLYRFRGLGHDLVSGSNRPYADAFSNLATGEFQEWMLGVEFTAPVGYRHGHAAVRHAELALSRERAVLTEQEKEVVSDLAGAVAEVDRAFQLAKTNYNRRMAAIYQLETLEPLLREADAAEKPRLLDLQLDGQRRLADAETQYYAALCEHSVAVKNVYLQKGALLQHNQIYLNEGEWPDLAYHRAARRQLSSRHAARLDNYVKQGPIVSRGPYDQVQPEVVAIENAFAEPPQNGSSTEGPLSAQP